MQDFYTKYQVLHQEIEMACSCIASNRCSVLQGEIEQIKSTVSGLSLDSSWQDSVGDAFETVKNACVSGLGEIINSIGSTFSKSETLYEQLKTDLDTLKAKNSEYQNLYKSKPDKDDYKKLEHDNNGKEKLKQWETEVEKLITECKTLQEKVETEKNQLVAINSEALSLKIVESLPKMGEEFANIFSTISLAGILGNIDISEFLTTMTFNGQTYNIIDTSKSYAEILKMIGKQTPDGCYDYSIKYMEMIFKLSQTTSKSGTYPSQNLLATSDEQTALQIMAKELLEGRTCVIRVNGNSKKGTRHFVLVTGLREGADLDHLKQSDFMIMDPAGGSLKVLNTDIGGQKRYLLKTEDDHGWRGRDGDSQGYLIGINNNDTEYLKYEGVEQGVAPHVNYNPAKTTGVEKKAELAERAKSAGYAGTKVPTTASQPTTTSSASSTSTDNSAIQYTTEIPSSVKQMDHYTVTCYEKDGWHKSASYNATPVGVGTGQKLVHDAWNSQGSHYENGVAVIDDNGTKRILVACTEKVGKVGDRITINYANGDKVDALVADQKSSGDSNYSPLGHTYGDKTSIIELEVNTQDYRDKHNPSTETWGLSWDTSSPITTIDNHGSAKGDLSSKEPQKA